MATGPGGEPVTSSLFASRSAGYTITQLPQRDEVAMSDPQPGFSNSKPPAAEPEADEVDSKVVAEKSVEDKAVSPSKTRKK